MEMKSKFKQMKMILKKSRLKTCCCSQAKSEGKFEIKDWYIMPQNNEIHTQVKQQHVQ